MSMAKKCFRNFSALGGYRINQLHDQLSFVKAAAYGYVNARVIFAGTNDLAVQSNFEMQSFIGDLKNMLQKFALCTGIERIVVIGFTPRAYCMKRNCLKSPSSGAKRKGGFYETCFKAFSVFRYL